MNYYKIELLSGSEVYALREYLQYADDTFSESIKAILKDDDAALCLGNLFAQLIKDELVFKHNVRQYRYIAPVQSRNGTLRKVNSKLCSIIARILDMEILDDYIEYTETANDDKLNEYIKNENRVKLNEKYYDTPAIIFNILCSTGYVFNHISSMHSICKENIYLSYGVRFNAENTSDSKIKKISEYNYEYDEKNKVQGYSVKIYGLFGEKNVEVDLRDHFSINIGENGYGKSTATKLAILTIRHMVNNSDGEVCEELLKYYFEKIEVYYHDYYYSFPEIENDEDVVHKNDQYVVRFVDSNDFCFHQQLIKKGKYINCAPLTVFGLDNHIETVNNSQKPIVEDMKIVYSDFVITYDFLLSNGSCAKSLVDTIYYDEICGLNDLMHDSQDDSIIYSFVEKIKKEELKEIIRKIIIDDRSIDVLYSKLAYTYGFSNSELKRLDKELRDKYNISNRNDTNANRYVCCLLDEGEGKEEYYFYFNCASSKKIVAKPPRERISTDHYYYKHHEDYIYGYERYDTIESDESNGYDYDAPAMFYYPAMFYEDMNNMYCQSLLRSEVKLVTKDVKNDDGMYPVFDHVEAFSSNKIRIYDIVNNFLSSKDIETNIYYIVGQIIYYSTRSYDNLDMVRIYVDDKHTICISLEQYMGLYKKDIEKIYNSILKDGLITLSFGVYDALNKKEYNALQKVVRRIFANGLNHISDYIVVVGLNILLKEYNKAFISERHIMYEKLINKYLVNKTMKVFHSNIAIQDSNGNYVPVDKLSTGEQNLIILFGLCLSWQENGLILDEPDLSMSVEWQSKILVDLLKYTNNKYLIISQSPLLVQKNSLSTFVKNINSHNDEKIIDYKRMWDLKNALVNGNKIVLKLHDDELPF